MRCTSLRTVGYYDDGKTICWSPKKYSKEFATFQLPCGKCISCRLENARQTAVRCVHEASMYEKNSFITLTYSEENLKSPKLVYRDFQLFVKKLRSQLYDNELKKIFPNARTQREARELARTLQRSTRVSLQEKISVPVFVAGEYGDRKKRPHWHAIIFNWRPDDIQHSYTNDRGDKVFTSRTLETLWPLGKSELGSVTLESAGYCARYAAKKLAHGKDGEHDYNPISRRSSKHAIGKKWIEKNWRDVFTYGQLKIEHRGEIITCGIPRYYEKWLKKHNLSEWERYVTQVKPKIQKEAQEKEERITKEEKLADLKRSGLKGLAVKHHQARAKILASKFNQLLKNQKDF
nr:MAG: replication initiator protein [Microvirus sp.]